ncbi:MAG: hypothetical protein PHE17_11195 [Thiothrix sp.]|uniref:hypothetical protein n=1 Tax=Thiothrix sp. TaxID=1032 RepID=UPI00261C95D6|nr:hypothetical protein [Thiothrix sp.]MDD5393573.1 hypothetical protein [Thiothrix sp.]
MFRKSLLAVSVLLALSLAACGGGGGGTTTTTSGVNIQQGVALIPTTVSVVDAK